jgi:hypothetical protein
VLSWESAVIVRTGDDLAVVDGEVRSLEWFWTAAGEMPGLDAFDELDDEAKAAVIATFRHWADLPHGKRASESRINEESSEPKILAAKAGKHRFTMFHAGGDIWVVHRHYLKRKTKLDKIGRTVVKTTVLAIDDYERRVKDGTYYGRG